MLNIVFTLMTQLMKRSSSPKSIGVILLLGSILALVVSNFSTIVGWFGYETKDVLKTKIVSLEGDIRTCESVNARIIEEFDLLKINSQKDYISLRTSCESEIVKLKAIININGGVAAERDKLKDKIEILEKEITENSKQPKDTQSDQSDPPEKEIQIVKYDKEKLDEQSTINLTSIQLAYDTLLGEFQ